MTDEIVGDASAEVFAPWVAAALEKLPAVIMEKGWIQGALRNERGVCLVGALDSLRGMGYHRSVVVQRALRDYLVAHGEVQASSYPGSWRLSAWNDRPGRTVNEVLDVVHETAIWIKGKIDD